MNKTATIAPGVTRSPELSVRRSIAALVFLVSALSLQTAWSQGTVRWAGGTSTAWETATNWVVVGGTPSTPPGAGDAVQIGTGAMTNQPTISSPTTIASITYGNVAASTLTINANLTVTGATTNTIATPARIHNINLSSGIVLSAASATLSPAVAAANMTITFNGGTFAVAGNFTAQPTTATTVITLTVGTGTFSVGGAMLQGAAANAARSCDITVSTGTLIFSGNYTKDGTASDLSSSGAGSISFGGNVTNTRGTSFNLTGSTTTFTGSGSITPTTAMTFGNVSVNTGVTRSTVTAAGTLTIAGNLTLDGTAALNGTEALLLTGASATIDGTGSIGVATTVSALHTIQATADLTITGTMTLSGAGNRIDNNGTVTAATIAGSVAGAIWTNLAGSTLNVSAALLATGTLTATANPNTVNYNGAVAQTVKATTYHDLVVAKTAGTATFGNTTINNDFSLTSGTATMGAFTILVSGSTQISGTLNITSATGTKTFVGPVTINSGGVWNNSGNEAITLRGGLTHDGTTFAAGTGIYTFDTNPQAIGGTSALTIPNVTITGVSLTNNGTLTTSTSLNGTGELINGAGSTLNINFTGAPGITTLTASSVGNTVSYGFAGAQTIKVPTASTYHHLTLASSGAKTAGGALTVNGDLTLSGTATFNGGTSLTHDFGGSWILNTTAATPFAFTTASTINFNTPSTPAQTSIGGTTAATIAFNNIGINNTSGFAANENMTASGTLTVAGGATLVPGAANTIGGAGTITGNGTAKVTRTAATPDFLSQYPIATKSLAALTVDYDATAAQVVNALNYFNLIIQGSRGANSVTLQSGTVGVSGAFDPIAGFTSGTYVVTGNTVDYNGGGAQAVQTINYNNLTLSNAGTKTFVSGTEGIAGTFAITGTAVADAASNPTTVDYNGGGAQTIEAINYNNLTLSNAGVKTFGAGTTGVAGNLTISGSATADAATNLSTIDYNGGGTQNVAAIDYYSLTFSNAGTKSLLSGTTRVASVFTVSGTAVADATTNSTTVEFNGTVNQTSPVVTYYNLVINNSGAPGRVNVYNVTVNNDFTILDGRGQVVGQNFTVLGTTTITNSAFWVTGTGGTKTFGDIVIDNGGLINFTVAENLTANGSLQVNTGGSITSGAGLWTFQKPGGGALNGSAASVSITNATFTTNYSNASTYVFGSLDISGATLTNNGSLTVSSALTGSGTLTQGPGASLDLAFTGALSLSTLNASAAGNTVIYSAAAAQTVSLLDYANLMLSGSGVKTISSGTTRVNGTVSLGGTATVDAITNSSAIEYNGGGGQTVLSLDYYDLTLSNSGTKTFASGLTRLAGTFDVVGSAVADATTNNPTLEFNGSGAQSVEALSYYGLVINNASGVALEGNVTITNLLTLSSGNIFTGANVVIVSATGGVTRTSGHVVGNLRKFIPAGTPSPTFEVGDATAYAPINLSFASVSVAGSFTASTTAGDHPQILASSIDAAKSVNRYWTLANSGVTFTTYDATFNFIPGDVDGSANPANFILDRHNGGTWTPPTVGTLTATSSQALGVAADGDFQIGELTLAVLKIWDGGAATNNWGDANNWSPDGVPTSLNNVSLTGANTININVAATANSITFNNASLIVTILSGNSLSAAGDLLLNSGTVNSETTFPSVTGTVSITGGTFGYTAAGNQTIAQQSYYHLSLSGSGTKTFSAGTTAIAGDLTLGGSASADATTNSTTVDYNGSGSQAIGAINYTNVTLSNAGVKTFGSGTVGVAGSLSITGSATADATTNATTVDYNGSGSQTVVAVNYHHLTLSNAGTKTLAAGTTGIEGNLTINGSASVDATTNATTVDYNGSGSQTVVAVNYHHLTLSNAGTKTLAAGMTGIAGDLTISGGATVDATTNATTVDYDGSGSQSVGAANYTNLVLSNAGTKTFVAGTTGIAGSLSVTGLASADATSNVTTINYNGSGVQSIAQIDYHHLVLSNASAKQFTAGTTNIFGDATIAGSATLDATTNATTVVFTGPGAQLVPAGDYSAITFANSGTKTLGSGTTRISGVFSITGSAVADLTTNTTTVEFNGSANQDAPAITYYNLIASNTGARLLLNGVTVNSDFTVQVGQARVAGFNFMVLGTTTLNSEFRVTAIAGAKTLGSVIVNSSGTMNFVAAEDLTINGDFEVNGSGAVTSNTGLWTFQKSGGGTFSGTAPLVSISNAAITTAYANTGSYSFTDLSITGTTFTNSGTVTITNSLAGTGTLAQGSGGTLNYDALSAIGVSGFGATASGNTVSYGAAGAQSVFVTDYHHLVLGGSGTKTFGGGTTRIAGTFDVTGTATGDATVNAPTVEFNGTAAQTVQGLNYYNVMVNNANGLVLNGTLTVTNTLTLTNGVVTTGADTLRIGASGNVSRTSGHIAGNMAKTIGTGSPNVTYEIGDAAGNYTPAIVAFVNVTVSAEMTAGTTTGDHPQILTSGIEPSKTVNRYWTLAATGMTYASYDLTMNFAAGDVDGGANTANFIVGRYESAAWTLPTAGTLTSTSSQATGIVGFGDFQIGEQSTAVLKIWDGGAATNNWGDASNWNPDGVPGSGNNVNLTGANTININVAASVNSITLNNSSLVVTIQTGNSLAVGGDFQMAGGVMNSETSFPSVAGTVSITGGTFAYAATGSQTIAQQSYYHLSLSGSGTKTFSAGTTTIAGDLTLGGSASADATTNGTTVDYNGSGSQAVGAMNYTNLALSNAGTKILASGTTGIAGNLTISGAAGVDATTNATTVDYNGSGSQTVVAFNYHHLALSNGGTKTLATGTTGVAGNLTISGGASADAKTNTTTVDYNGSGGQTVGAVDYTNLVLSNAGTKTFASGTARISGDFVVSGTAAGDAATNSTLVEFDGASAQNIGAASFFDLTLSNGSAKILGAGTTSIAGLLTLTGGATLDALAGATTIDFNGNNQTIPAIDYYHVTFSNAGTKTLSSGTTSVTGNVVVSGSATVDALTNSSTVQFTGTLIQTSSPITYYNLAIYKTSNRLTLNDLAVNNDFTVQAGEGRLAAGSFTVAGTTTVTELLRVTSVAATPTFGNIVINNTGTLNFSANPTVVINGDVQVDGGAVLTSGTGVWTFQKPGGGGTLSGTAATVSITNAAFTTDYTSDRSMTFGDLAIAGATLTNNQTMVVGTSLSGTGAITQGAGATLSLTFIGTSTLAGLNASAANNTVNYSAAGDQTVLPANYYDLTFATSGTKTLSAGTIGVASALTIGGTAVGDGATNASTVDYNGSGAQSIAVMPYHHLTLSNAGTKAFQAGTTQIGGHLTVTGSASADATTNSSAVTYNGANPENVASMSYYDLTLTGGGAKTAAGDLTIVNNFDNSSVTAIGTFTLSIGGSKANTGTMQFAGAANGVVFAGGTVEYNGTNAQAPAGQTVALGTYANLLFSSSAVKRITGGTVHSQSALAIGAAVSLIVTSDGTLWVDGDLDNQGSLTNNGNIEIGN